MLKNVKTNAVVLGIPFEGKLKENFLCLVAVFAVRKCTALKTSNGFEQEFYYISVHY